MIRKIVGVKNIKLRKKSKPVKNFDRKIQKLVTDMKDTLSSQKDPEGVGLAAPQIGKNLRIFVVNYDGNQKVVINPKILKVENKKQAKKKKEKNLLEGCLSLPHYYGPIKRPNFIKIKYKNELGKEVTEEFKGFMAQIIQHEVDHLNGIIFIDRVLEQKSPLYKFSGEDWEEVELL